MGVTLGLRKRLYLLLDPIDGRLTGAKPRALGPFRVVQFCSEGIYAAASLLNPRRIATVNDAGRYVLAEDGTEWDSARVATPMAGVGPEQLL